MKAPLLLLLLGGVGFSSANAQPASSTPNGTSPDAAVCARVQPAASTDACRSPERRTFWDALKGDFLGRRGRDMFNVSGTIRMAPPTTTVTPAAKR